MSVVEIEVDKRGRASLKAAGITQGRYRVTRMDHHYVLEPVISYTEAELAALQDEKVRAAHQAAERGETEFSSSAELP